MCIGRYYVLDDALYAVRFVIWLPFIYEGCLRARRWKDTHRYSTDYVKYLNSFTSSCVEKNLAVSRVDYNGAIKAKTS